MKNIFTCGLHPYIKSDVLALRPSDLNYAISLTFLQKQKRATQSNLMMGPTIHTQTPIAI